MASSSSSTSFIQKSFKYDVFLSFRGEDTRKTFVDHLFQALKLKNIETYKDDKNLEKGKKISKELIEAIEDSRFHVIIFSKNYASSSWCLNELGKIMECQKMQTEQTVYPIFYDVEASEVRNQSGAFGEAFAKHKNKEDAGKWRKALEDATYFSGWDLRTIADGHEVDFIKLVVKHISLKLPSVSADENLVGMKTRINGVVSSLNAFPDEFCMIGIWGMGGSGKTTLARAVFDQISFQFEGISFVANVREVSKPDFSGLKKLQQQVLRDVSNDQDITINNVFDGKTMMKKKMVVRKVLVVLDDVDHIDQLKALAGEPNWFKPGSKIIITTRDKQILVAHKVVNSNIHDVNLLTQDEAICLLSRCAFGTESPSPGYEELSQKVVSYAVGLPLTITILGLSLCDANEHVWIDTLERLQKIPLEETLQKLELSYIGLDTDCKEIFLDVACILKGWKEDQAIRALESRGFHAIRGLSILEKKSLVTISRGGHLDMHDHIEEMGRYIVRRLHPDEPNKHSRLWIAEEITDILANNQGTEATTCIYANLLGRNINLETFMKGLGKMEKLRLICMCYIDDIFSDRELDEVSQYFPNSLQYLDLYRYSFSSLPKTFQASNLVVLKVDNSRMKQLWKGGERKVLHKLKFLDLSLSSLRSFDLGLTPNLEMLILEHCGDLVEFHMPLECPKLKSLKLTFSKLTGPLDLRLVPNIETLNLEENEYLEELDISCEFPKLKSLNLSYSKLRSLNLGLTPNIETLVLIGCEDLVELEMPCECPQLKSLNVSGAKLRSLNLGLTPKFETLNLRRCEDLVELNICDGDVNLESLVIKRCSKLKTLNLVRTPNLKRLCLKECFSLVKLHAPVGGLKNLINLKAHLSTDSVDICPFHPDSNFPKFQFECSYKEDLPSSIGNIENFNLEGFSCPCTGLQRFFGSICDLEHLTKLSLGASIAEVPKDLDRLQCLKQLTLKSIIIKLLPDSICMLKHLEVLKIKDCKHLEKLSEELGRLQCLEKLTLYSTKIKHLPDSICMLKHLKDLKLIACKLLMKLPEDLGRLECLEMKDLKLIACKLLMKLPEDLGRLECLEMLILHGCIVLRDIPNSTCRMKRLMHFSLSYCETIEELPEELGHLECLKYLDIRGTSINNLPRSILLLEGLRIVRSEDETPTRVCCTVL